MDSPERRPMKRRAVTLHDVARRCGVCAATVSRALKRDPRISPTTMARVIAAAEEIGYDPSLHEAARRMVLSRHGIEMINHVVALFFPQKFFETAYFSGIYRGAIDVLAAGRFAPLLMHQAGVGIPGHSITLPRIFDRGEVDGVLLLEGGPLAFQQLSAHLREATGFAERPIVSLIWTASACSSVVTDDQQGAYQAATHLLDLGHRHLLHYFSTGTDDLHRQRHAGIRQAYQERGLNPDRYQHILDLPQGWYNPGAAPLQATPGGLPLSGGMRTRDEFLTYLRAHPQITAIMAPNDGAALHVWYALRWAGLRVPEDYSVIGFDDTDPMSDEHGANLLTSVHLPLEDVGQQGAALLLQRIHGEAGEDIQRVLPTSLIVRASTALPRLVPK